MITEASILRFHNALSDEPTQCNVVCVYGQWVLSKSNRWMGHWERAGTYTSSVTLAQLTEDVREAEKVVQERMEIEP